MTTTAVTDDRASCHSLCGSEALLRALLRDTVRALRSGEPQRQQGANHLRKSKRQGAPPVHRSAEQELVSHTDRGSCTLRGQRKTPPHRAGEVTVSSAFVVLETSAVRGANKMSFSVITCSCRTFRLPPTQACFSALYKPAPPRGISPRA